MRDGEQITSNKNTRVKHLRSLAEKKYRYRYCQLVIEGLRLVEDALAAGVNFLSIFYSPYLYTRPGGEELLKKLTSRPGVECNYLTDELLQEVADTESPQGLLAIIEWPRLKIDNHKRLLLIDGLKDPGNLGTVIRTAAAVGCGGILLMKGTVDPYNPKVVRATMGAIFRIPLLFFPGTAEALDWVQERKLRLVVAERGGTTFYQLSLTRDLVLVIGSEAEGVSKALIEAAEAVATVPLSPGVESLNASIASGIILYEVYRQQEG